jgi:hypothetical protein
VINYFLPHLKLSKYLKKLNEHKKIHKWIPKIIMHGKILLYASIILILLSFIDYRFILFYMFTHYLLIKYDYVEFIN